MARASRPTGFRDDAAAETLRRRSSCNRMDHTLVDEPVGPLQQLLLHLPLDFGLDGLAMASKGFGDEGRN